MTKTIAVAVVAALIMFTIINTLKTTLYRKMVSNLENGEYADFDEKINRKWTQFLFPKTSILDLKLNAALVQKKKKEAIRLLDELCSLPLVLSQKENYYMKAFNFFVGINDEKNSGRYLKKINELPNDRIKLEANRVYNIFILKNDKDLGDLLQELEGFEEDEKGINEYLISVIYKNKKDLVNAKKFEELSRKHFASIDEKTARKLEKEKFS
ncbi:hypothetical protein [uncultured Dubosiella sp.]|uniref:hypothetical protein n=2 Tax=uncultured Dubosiella sp. TaxID=1937011 RepID=UPI00208895BB|nr:hypothetical protein [uncultured Dubosiella sp.]GJM56491.1 hypothetical protein EROP_01840 [Erysipelotrichaceae bacterium OPF54]